MSAPGTISATLTVTSTSISSTAPAGYTDEPKRELTPAERNTAAVALEMQRKSRTQRKNERNRLNAKIKRATAPGDEMGSAAAGAGRRTERQSGPLATLRDARGIDETIAALHDMEMRMNLVMEKSQNIPSTLPADPTERAKLVAQLDEVRALMR